MQENPSEVAVEIAGNFIVMMLAAVAVASFLAVLEVVTPVVAVYGALLTCVAYVLVSVIRDVRRQ